MRLRISRMDSLKYIVVLVLCSVLFVPAKSETMVYLLQADHLKFDEARIADAQIVQGNVIFRHEEALMYCDSAYFY